MLKHLARLAVALVVVGYAAWVAWPLIAPFTAGGDVASAAEVVLAEVRRTNPTQAAFWIGAAVFYLAAAVLTAVGHVRASGAFLFAYLSEVMLRLLALEWGATAAADLGARTADQFARWGIVVDPAPVALGSVAILGLIVLALEFWPRQTARPRRARVEPTGQEVAA